MDESIVNKIIDDNEKIDLSTVLMNLHNIFLGEVIYKSWYKLSISI